VVIYGKLPVNT